jgi:ATP-dependent Clp protease ATP-binding subunit ClpC
LPYVHRANVQRSQPGTRGPVLPDDAPFHEPGPTGVGKTELAKAPAEFMFGGEDNLITLDMTEYRAEDHSEIRARTASRVVEWTNVPTH